MHSLTHLTRPLGRLLAALLGALALSMLLVGVPWGLQTYLGWPLPDHLPTWNEIEAVLLNPLSVVVLLDILGCVAWSAWLIFVIDVVRCAPDVVRGIRPPSAGPIQSVAMFLLVVIVAGVIGQRGTSPSSATFTSRNQPAQISQRVTATPSVALVASSTVGVVHDLESDHEAVVVRAPRNGVHDSLWRIARRELGDGALWRTIFEINEGRAQPSGQRLTDPNLIRPGWVLLMPGNDLQHAPAPTRPEPSKRPAQPAPSIDPSTPVPEEAPQRPGARENLPSTGSMGVMLVTGGFLSAVLASAATGAVLMRRRRRIRGYRTHEDEERSSSLAPVVRALRIVDDQHQLDLDPATVESESLNVATTSPSTAPASKTSVDIGIRSGHAYAVDLAASHGLGVTGAGAEATVRALLVHLLGSTGATVVIPEDDAIALLGSDLPESPRLRITSDLNGALDELSTTLGQARTDDDLAAVLVATIVSTNSRLQSLLDNGAEHGVAGIVLGHWPAGGTVRVRADGTVTAASPTMNPALQGARLFHVDATDTRDLIRLFSDVPKSREPDTPEGRFDELSPGSDSVADVTRPELDEDSEMADVVTPQEGEDTVSVVEQEPNQQEHTVQSEGDTTGQRVIPGLETTSTPQRSLTLDVFGPVTLHENTPEGPRDLTPLLAPKHKALLALLALYPGGTTREVVREAMWPEARQRRPFNAFYATVSQIRKILTTADDHTVDLIDQRGEHVALDSALVEVDYWQHQQAEHDRRSADTEEKRLAACSSIVAAYRGELAEGMTFLWLDGPREAAHRDTVDALASMAAHCRGVDPERQLQLLEHARLLNPENEDIYRDIMRVQAELGRTDAISRTLHLLTTALADIGAKPEPDTLILARALRNRQRNRASVSEASG